ncbi:palmitoyltransferase Hip14 isoform X1 [Frankliniella occidentalis]|uniref:Palmitoyltransferase n=1 Tax=Frankliniella occidentalis TaxID=133901 RepID=A0A6J1RSH4_FRAOC|nr:palmitoyltransferase Hip14 isoform X1 [Frankliniella occidentalis]XP_026271984.1 palmitoyltransferase Hip14 isoform X1 [Frankliniella occidentalis]XP_026271986.1 palmitoyltransferase Hip14 isoform X1 [Frankliniella occidentalis]
MFQQVPQVPQAKGSTSDVDYSNLDIIKATQNGALERCKQLIDEGFDINQRDTENVTLLHWAAINNRKEIIRFYISRGALVDAVGGDLMATPLHWATRAGHLGAVVLLMQHGADPLICDGDGLQCIHIAAQLGFAGIMAYFIAKGANMDGQDRGGMTPLMWSAYRVTRCASSSLDPTRMLLTLGASSAFQDNFHGNTAIHWAIVARNSTAVTTLVTNGANLTTRNNTGQTPYDLLKGNRDMFLSEKVLEKMEEVERNSRPKSTCDRLTKNKKVKVWITGLIPASGIFIIGQLFQSSIPVPIKCVILLLSYVFGYFARPYVCNDKYFTVLPLATYFGTKFWVYMTWLVWIVPHVNIWSTIAMLISSILLWYNFLKVWKGDPGIVSSTREEKFRLIIDEAEKRGFDSRSFCSSCLVHKPLRSKHCGVCDRCIAKHDHHCPWVSNCIGEKNHRHFIGYLIMLLVMIFFMIYGASQYWQKACDIPSSSGFFGSLIASAQCDAWVMWITFNCFLHAIWVFLLLGCQTYQIVILGMTTNERLNHWRYQHFQQGGVSHSPFHRGYFQNLVDFFGWHCFGLLHPDQTDWSKTFHVGAEAEHPLLNTKENYQYV